MDFNTFKSKYEEKLQGTGAEIPDDDTIATIYLGLQIFNEWQVDQAKEAQRKAKRQQNKPKIHVPRARNLKH